MKPFGKVSNYNVNVFNRNKLIPVICFFPESALVYVVRLIGIKLLIIFPYYPFNVSRSCSDGASLTLDTSHLCLLFPSPSA